MMMLTQRVHLSSGFFRWQKHGREPFDHDLAAAAAAVHFLADRLAVHEALAQLHDADARAHLFAHEQRRAPPQLLGDVHRAWDRLAEDRREEARAQHTLHDRRRSIRVLQRERRVRVDRVRVARELREARRVIQCECVRHVRFHTDLRELAACELGMGYTQTAHITSVKCKPLVVYAHCAGHSTSQNEAALTSKQLHFEKWHGRSGVHSLSRSLWSDAHITASTRRFSSHSLTCLLYRQEPFWNESGSVLTVIMHQQLHQRRARRRPFTTLLTTLTHFFLVAFYAAHAQEDAPSPPLFDVPEQSGVLLLSASDVAAAVLTFQPLFVLFDSPTRKESLELFRTFADAAVALRASQRKIVPHMRFAAMDATEPSDLLDELNVVGLPVFLRFRCNPNVANLVGTSSNSESGSDTTATSTTNFSVTTTSSTSIVAGCSLDDADIDTYTSGRTSAEFQRFMLEQPQKEVAILHDRAALDALMATYPFVVLIVVDGRDTQPYFDAISLAQTDAQVISMYAVSANRALLDTEAERQQIPSVVVFRDFGATRILYTGPWKKSRVVSFLQLNKYSLVSTYSHEFSGFLFDGRAAAHVLLFSDVTSELGYHEKLMTQAEELAQQYASTIGGALALRFVYVPRQETALRDAMFVKDHHVPIVLIIENVADPPFRFPLFGQELIVALETSQFLDSLGELLATKFPPVFQTVDGDVDVDVAVDDSPGFEDTVVSSSPASTTSSDAIITAVDEQQPSRLLREVVWADHALSPWEVRRQQSHIVNVSSALWVLNQQQQERKHVVVCFSSPRCYGCRAFAKVFEEVAHLTIDALDALDADRGAQPIVFAKVNVDEVDITPLHLDFSRLPSIYVFPSGGRGGPIPYSFRSFTRANVLAFVGETCSTSPAEQ